MTSSGYPGAPPGWYADPAGGPGQRWWDGYAWTDATVLPQQPPPPPWSGAAPPQGPPLQVAPWAEAAERLNTFDAAAVVNNELRMVPVARFAVAMPAVYFIVTLIFQRIDSSDLLSFGQQLREHYHDVQVGVTPPPYHGATGFSPVSVFVGLVTVVAVVLACMWQHRAASAGRALGIPAAQSPAWGVGSWFVPIVNLWIPCLAIRDCLPPGHPHRARVVQWWIALLVAGWTTAIAGFVAFFSSGAALVLAIPAALAAIAVLAWAPGIVIAIASAHRAAMAELGERAGAVPV